MKVYYREVSGVFGPVGARILHDGMDAVVACTGHATFCGSVATADPRAESRGWSQRRSYTALSPDSVRRLLLDETP